jgi:hypothetical protein
MKSTTDTVPSDDPGSPEAESQYHTYLGNRIPWYVRMIWLGFWVFTIYYVITYLFPDLQSEILTRP